MENALMPAAAPDKILLQTPNGLVEVTAIYQKYEVMVTDLATVNSSNGPFYMREFLLATNLVADALARISHEMKSAQRALHVAESVAHLEKAPAWLESQQRKVTEAACEKYIQLDHEYRGARERYDYLTVTQNLLEMKLRLFQTAHDDAKKIFDKTSQPYGSATGAPSGN